MCLNRPALSGVFFVKWFLSLGVSRRTILCMFLKIVERRRTDVSDTKKRLLYNLKNLGTKRIIMKSSTGARECANGVVACISGLLHNQSSSPEHYVPRVHKI